jgi:hypothetical protein
MNFIGTTLMMHFGFFCRMTTRNERKAKGIYSKWISEDMTRVIKSVKNKQEDRCNSYEGSMTSTRVRQEAKS